MKIDTYVRFDLRTLVQDSKIANLVVWDCFDFVEGSGFDLALGSFARSPPFEQTKSKEVEEKKKFSFDSVCLLLFTYEIQKIMFCIM